MKQFIHAGCFIVSPTKRHSWMNAEFLPEKIISISVDIGKIIPVNWQEIIKEEFVSPSNKKEISNWVNVNLEKKRIMWPNIISSVDIASELIKGYLQDMENIKIIDLGIEKNDAVELIENSTYDELGEVENLLTLEQTLITSPNNIIGFDILGLEHGYFTSYLVNQFEKELVGRVGVNINQYGLIPDYEEAKAGADYLLNESCGGESLLWKPWIMVDRTQCLYENNMI